MEEKGEVAQSSLAAVMRAGGHLRHAAVVIVQAVSHTHGNPGSNASPHVHNPCVRTPELCHLGCYERCLQCKGKINVYM